MILDVEKPAWIDVAANNALISSKELMAWLGIASRTTLWRYMKNPDFPAPCMGKSGVSGAMLRWRVGDVRAWLKQQSGAA